MPRKRIQIPVPVSEFTVADLKLQYPDYSASLIQTNLEKWVQEGVVTLVGTRKAPHRRKPFNVYRPAGQK